MLLVLVECARGVWACKGTPCVNIFYDNNDENANNHNNYDDYDVNDNVDNEADNDESDNNADVDYICAAAAHASDSEHM